MTTTATTTKELPPSLVSPTTASNAVKSLIAYLQEREDQQQLSSNKHKSQLLSSDPFIYIVIALQFIPTKSSHKLHRIPLQHPIYDNAQYQSEYCLITADATKLNPNKDAPNKTPQSTTNIPAKKHALKDLSKYFKAHPLPGLTQVMTIKEFRLLYKKALHDNKGRRDMVNQYDMFLADNRLAATLKTVIGKEWLRRKKQPVLVELRKPQNMVKEIKAAVGSTYVSFARGNTVMVKVARQSMSRQEIIDNILAALPAIAQKLPRQNNAIQAIYVRTSDSIALPLYATLPPSDTTRPSTAATTSADRDVDPLSIIDRRIKNAFKSLQKKRKERADNEDDSYMYDDDEIYNALTADIGDDEVADVKASRTQAKAERQAGNERKPSASKKAKITPNESGAEAKPESAPVNPTSTPAKKQKTSTKPASAKSASAVETAEQPAAAKSTKRPAQSASKSKATAQASPASKSAKSRTRSKVAVA